ncbi:MAG: hypothetical protein K8F62_15325 [Pseudorhodoplanes sp.]|nr:hypothetical protein [Pseudorhodoplanes sp.]
MAVKHAAVRGRAHLKHAWEELIPALKSDEIIFLFSLPEWAGSGRNLYLNATGKVVPKS